MELHVFATYHTLSSAAADWFVQRVAAHPTASVVLATGSSPMGMYQELAARRRDGSLDVSRLRVFQLDAYLGLEPGDRRSLYRWLDESFLTPLEIPVAHVVSLPGNAVDPQAACKEYDDAVAEAGGFDLSVLGLGPNGHLGFNEPPVDPQSVTRIIELTEESMISNATYWGGRDQVPPKALTAGMRSLLAARHTLLIVSGARKHNIVRRTVEGPVTPEVPGSYLQQVPNVTLMVDRAAWLGDDQA